MNTRETRSSAPQLLTCEIARGDQRREGEGSCRERSFDAVLEAREAEDSAELASDVGPCIAGQRIQLTGELLAAVDEQDDIFEVPTCEAIVVAAVGERLELGDHQPRRRDDPQLGAGREDPGHGGLDCRLREAATETVPRYASRPAQTVTRSSGRPTFVATSHAA
jgi:hypothetical protein